MSDAMHMLDANNAALATRVQELQRENTALRSDLAALCTLLREVRYVQTVGEINRFRMARERAETRWQIKAVQP